MTLPNQVDAQIPKVPANLSKAYASVPAIDHNKIRLDVKEPHDDSNVDEKLLETLAKQPGRVSSSSDSRAADIDELSCNDGIEEEIGET